MKLKISSSAIALSLALVSAPALAADLGSIKDTYEAPPPPVVNWTGFYVSAGLGGSYMFTDLDGGVGAYDDADNELAFVGAAGNAGAANFFGTVGLGYDFQMAPKWLFGVLADYDFASSQDASVSGGGAILNGLGAAAVTVSSEMGDTWSVGARLGYLINPRTLVYAMGGYSEAEFSLSGSVEGSLDGEDFGPYSVSSGKSWRQGYFVGGGLETMLAENLSAKLEYRYAQYDGGSFDVLDTFDAGAIDGDVIGGASMSDPDVHSIRAALSWRFGNWGR